MRSTDKKDKLKKYTLISYVAAVSVGVSAIEDFLFLSFPFPGVNAGLNNVVILAFSRLVSIKDLVALQTLKVLLNWMLFKGFSLISLFMSLSGTLAATVVLISVLKYSKKQMSFAGASSLMAASHITAQLVAVSLLVGNTAPLAYLGISGIFSTGLGFLSGIIANILYERLIQVSAA